MSTRLPGLPAVITLGVLALSPASARSTFSGNGPFCAAVPRADWLSFPEIEMRLKEAGYQVVRMRLANDRCYTVSVRDIAGQMLDLIIHPVTAEIMRAVR